MRRIISTVIFVTMLLSTSAQTIRNKVFAPLVSFERATFRADSICQLMSEDDKISLIRGYQYFYIHPFPKYNIPAIYLADATQGVRIRQLKDTSFLKVMKKSTAFPNPLQLAATWNRSLSYDYAQAIGEEARSGGIHVLLGPGVNVYRNSQCGRNFEYMGEDPFLIGQMASNYITGMQSTGTMATIKHFIANNTDLDRRKSNSIVDERALHEIYMPGFKAGIDAGVMSVMTSYNLVNGEWAGQSEYVINQLLRKDLGFKWLVMTDWTSVWDAEKIIKSGQDLEMPLGASLEATKSLLASGKIEIGMINKMVKNILKTCIAMGFYDRTQLDKSMESKFEEHEKIALQTAREGIVLLKNRNNILPLKSKQEILLTGKFVDSNAFGKGAAFVAGYNTMTMQTALNNEFGKRLKYIKSPSDEEIRTAPVVILSTGTLDGESIDRPFDLPSDENERINRICSLNANTIVIVNSGSGINMTSWSEKAAAIIYAWYPGQIGQLALAEILSGKTNPSGKLPMTIEKKFEDSPAYGYVPANRVVKWPGSVQSPKTGDRSLIYDIQYKEGIFVGYRWYDHKKIAPLFYFGEGLSYTSFTYSNLKTTKGDNDVVQVSFRLTNTGSREGAETAQLYVSDKACSVERPVKELKGFEKVFLKKGESKTVTLTLNKHDFEFWHPQKKEWVFENGEFELQVGSSSNKCVLINKISL
jgi:beta-glucosidase